MDLRCDQNSARMLTVGIIGSQALGVRVEMGDPCIARIYLPQIGDIIILPLPLIGRGKIG